MSDLLPPSPYDEVYSPPPPRRHPKRRSPVVAVLSAFTLLGILIVGYIMINFLDDAFCALFQSCPDVLPTPTSSPLMITATLPPSSTPVVILATAPVLTATPLPSTRWIPTRSTSELVRAYVNTPGDTLNIRSGPGVDYPILGKLPHQSVIMLDGRNDTLTWVHVQTRGWVSYRYVVITEGDPRRMMVMSADGGATASTAIRTPPLSPSTNLSTAYGNFTRCQQQNRHQVECFVPDADNSPDRGSIQMEPAIIEWILCIPDSVTQRVIAGRRQNVTCSKTGAGYFLR
jgi:uncharacterized protein YraI